MRLILALRLASGLHAATAAAAIAVIVAGVATAGFIAGREWRDSGSSAADEDGTDSPGPEVTPDPQATPDTSQDWWFLPYQYADDRLPRYDQSVAGILLGPSVVPESFCGGAEVNVPEQAVIGSTVEIRPSYLPAGAIRTEFPRFATCRGQPAYAQDYYWIPTNEDDMRLVKSRQISFFEARHGGAIEIIRIRLTVPKFQTDFPSGRFRAEVLAGRPAAVGPPIFEAGWGSSELFIWDAGTAVLTIVRGADISLVEIRTVAEGLFK